MESGNYLRSLLLPWVLSGLFLSASLVHAEASRSFDVVINDEITINILSLPAAGDKLLLWFPSGPGFVEQEKHAAVKLAAKGIEVWFADLLSAWFLPTLPSSMDKLPASELADFIEAVREKSNKQIMLVANGRGALPVLRAARKWKQRYGASAGLSGVILISPNLYVSTPEPGMEGEYMPVARYSNLPIFIIQPGNSPWRWKLKQTVSSLSTGGSDVYAWVLANIRDRFYFRPDATADEDRQAGRLSYYLLNADRLLGGFNQTLRGVRTGHDIPVVERSQKKERTLRAYTGNPSPPVLQLKNLQGNNVDLNNFRGKVVLVNFWASWCPPCVHEMPSMQRLSDRLSGKPFKILAVNMAEDDNTVKKFLQEKVNVRFTILMDRDGKALTRWKVFAFPTSYVIDRKGKIRLALFGAIDWMQDDVLLKINRLMDE